MIFILERPARGYGRIEDEGQSVSMALVPGGQQCLDGDFPRPLLQRPYGIRRRFDLRKPAVLLSEILGHEPCNGTASTGYDNGFSLLDVIEQLRKLCLNIKVLDLTHDGRPLGFLYILNSRTAITA